MNFTAVNLSASWGQMPLKRWCSTCRQCRNDGVGGANNSRLAGHHHDHCCMPLAMRPFRAATTALRKAPCVAGVLAKQAPVRHVMDGAARAAAQGRGSHQPWAQAEPFVAWGTTATVGARGLWYNLNPRLVVFGCNLSPQPRQGVHAKTQHC